MEENMSNLTCASGEASFSSSSRNNDNSSTISQNPIKKKRNQPGHPEPGAEVIALSPRTLLATNRFVCDVCNKGFKRDQNLQLHRRGHNLPWKLKQKSSKEVRRKVYICPEIGCVHHEASRALGDLTGIKKHFYRKHGEKKWKCEKCSKKYAVQSDWKAHSKICGTREYRCECGTLFSRRDSFITHRAFCDALAQENVRSSNSFPFQFAQNPSSQTSSYHNTNNSLAFSIKKEHQNLILKQEIPPWLSSSPIIGPGLAPPPPIDLTTTPSFLFQDFHQNQDFAQNHHDDNNQNPNPNPSSSLGPTALPPYNIYDHHYHAPPHVSATALLQKASLMGAKSSSQQFSFLRPHVGDHVTTGPSPTDGFGPFGQARDQLIHGLASYADKAAPMTGGDGGGGGGGGATPLVHEMMMMNNGGFYQGPEFSHVDLDQDEQRFHASLGLGGFSSRSNGNKGDNMTRDFLGLRPLMSQNDILSLTGFDSCMNKNNSNSCEENHDQTPKSW